MAVEHFNYKGQGWRRVTFAPERNFCVGLDLGQAHDPTALAVVERHVTPQQEFIENHDARVITQVVREFFDVRHLERLPLNTSYVDIAAYVANVMNRSPLRDSGAELVVDQTGVGRPVVDILRRSGLRFKAVTITGGDDEIRVSSDEFRVPKSILVAAVDARLAVKELRFADKLHDARAMQAEMKDFRRQISATGHVSFNARSSAHDDLILATALSVWWLGARRVPRGSFSCGFVRGLTS